jgi:hypothetical protein
VNSDRAAFSIALRESQSRFGPAHVARITLVTSVDQTGARNAVKMEPSGRTSADLL